MARRFDPDRRERILDAALTVIAEHGVAGTTHRRIAAVADVPLGSLTYHFAGLDDLVACAFARFAERGHAAWAAHFDDVDDVSQLVDTLTDLVMSIVQDDALGWTVSYELYLAAVRRPELREVPEQWMQASRAVLRRWVDAETAQDLDALVEGLSMHQYLTTTSPTRAEVRRAFARMVPTP
ncbi:MAG: TetR family transcriptional regulator [Actinomycetota bacterium]|nr:TetR family transcriptional regulator [Actinomycetota bacterium]